LDQEKTKCPNCEKEFDSSYNFCPYCGQKNIAPNPKVKHFISEFLSANFNLDSKIFLTLKTLVLKPAALSKEYLAGKREKYITPVRLYLFISLVYFFVISFSPGDNTAVVHVNKDDVTDSTQNTLVAVSVDDVNPDTLKGFDKLLYHKLEVIRSPYGEKVFLQSLQKNISLGMFIFIPLAALILFVIYRRKTKYYVPNLIFAIHLQALIFLWLTVFHLLSFLSGSYILIAAEALFLLYLFFSWFRAFYEDPTWKTIRKMMLAGIVYLFFGLIFFFINIGISFWFID